MVRTSSILWIVLGLGVVLLYYLIDPMESGIMPQCVFHKLTGLQCMGCGTQRMLHALLHGDLRGAMEANAMVVLLLPFLGGLVWIEINRTRYPRLYVAVHSRGIIIGFAVILMAWGILRNLMGW